MAMAVLKFDKEHGTELSNLLLKLKHSRSAMVGCSVGYERFLELLAVARSVGFGGIALAETHLVAVFFLCISCGLMFRAL